MPLAPPRGTATRFVAILVAALFALLHLAACGGGGSAEAPGSAPPPPPEPLPPSSAGSVAFVGVDVVPMDSELLLVDQTVLVRAGRIEAVGARADLLVPADATEGEYPPISSDLGAIGGVYSFQPHGTSFVAPATALKC